MFWQILLIFVILIPILAIILDSQVGRALAARLERRGLGEGDDVLAARIDYLEGEVERLGGELLRLEEESRFLHDLLAERQEDERRLPPGDRQPGREPPGRESPGQEPPDAGSSRGAP